jgi:hypothetical protein
MHLKPCLPTKQALQAPRQAWVKGPWRHPAAAAVPRQFAATCPLTGSHLLLCLATCMGSPRCNCVDA